MIYDMSYVIYTVYVYLRTARDRVLFAMGYGLWPMAHGLWHTAHSSVGISSECRTVDQQAKSDL